MNRSKAVGILVGGISFTFIAFVVFLFLIKILWAWTIPDLLSGSGEQELIAESISWLAAGKIAIFVAILSGIVAVVGLTRTSDAIE